MALVFDYPGELEAVEFLEERLSAYVAPLNVSRPPEGVPRSTHAHFPRNFRGKYPALACQWLYSEGRSILDEAEEWPGTIAIGLRIYYPSQKREDMGITDSRRAARRVTAKIFSAWREAFFADWNLQGQVDGIEIGRQEMGDYDRLGNPYVEPESEGRTLLWIHGAEILFHL